jgi:SAM-dependent methyltransferase
LPAKPPKSHAARHPPGNGDRGPVRPKIGTILESKEPQRRSLTEYRRFVREHYDGFPGALTTFTGMLTGHELLAGQLFRPGGFEVRGCKRILDAACGNGRYTRFLLKHADRDAVITAFDYSRRMLHRARKRLHTPRVHHVTADLIRLPFPDGYFDAIVCGWVLEHLLDPRPGLRELARVLAPGGKVLILTTEDTFNGAVCSRLWHCRTYNRTALRGQCRESGLDWHRELWFTRVHAFFHLGGIVAELCRHLNSEPKLDLSAATSS